MKKLVYVCMALAVILAVSASAAAATCTETKYERCLHRWRRLEATFSSADVSGPDTMLTEYRPIQLALLAAAMCQDTAVQTAYDTNLTIATEIQTDDPLGWAIGVGLAPQIAAEALYDNASWQIVLWYFGFDWLWDDAGFFAAYPSLISKPGG